jgi:symplekin
MIGEVGSKHTAYIPDVMPSLLDLLNDETPAVARQAVKTGTDLFAKVLQQLVIQVILLIAAPL